MAESTDSLGETREEYFILRHATVVVEGYIGGSLRAASYCKLQDQGQGKHCNTQKNKSQISEQIPRFVLSVDATATLASQ